MRRMKGSASLAKYASRTVGMMALSLLAIVQSAIAADDRSAALILADAVEHDRALIRPEYLSALVKLRVCERAIVRAVASRDASVRRVAAL
jgi:hypothetical protein